MEIIIDSKKFSNFIEDNYLLKRTQEYLETMLKNWWKDNKSSFLENLNSDLETVLNNYTFKDEGVALNKNYSYSPPMDYVSVWISIFDEEDDYLLEYTAFYDNDLNCFDDKIK